MDGLRLARGTYFMYFAAIGSFLPYLNVHYKDIGLTGGQIGLIGAVPPLMMIASSTFWSAISDRFNLHRAVMLTAMLGAALVVQIIGIVQIFYVLLPLTALFAFFMAPVGPLLDSTVLKMLGDAREKYGQQRVWGSIGFVVASSIAGALIENATLRWIFYSYSFLILCALIFAWRIPQRPQSITPPLRTGLMQFLHSRQWALFLLSLMVLGFTIQGTFGFLALYIVHLGGGESMIGLAWALGAAVEIPIMFFAPRLLRRIRLRHALLAVYGLYTLRWFLYAFLPSAGWAVAISALHGLTFGGLWIAGVAYADRHAPPGLAATAQSLFAGTVFGLSGGIGLPLAGFLFDWIGPNNMFLVFAVIAAIATIVFWIAQPEDTPTESVERH